MKLDRFSRKTLALAMGLVSGFLSRPAATVRRKDVVDRYPNGFNKAQENARRRRQADVLKFHRDNRIED